MAEAVNFIAIHYLNLQQLYDIITDSMMMKQFSASIFVQRSLFEDKKSHLSPGYTNEE